MCFKEFANKSNLNRHTETFHRSYVQPPVDEFDDPTQSGELYGDDNVQSTSQTKFENADNQVGIASQDDDWSTTDGEASDSDGYYGDSDFSDSSDDEEYDDKLRDSESEMYERDDEINGESKNDEVSTDKEKVSKPHNPR